MGHHKNKKPRIQAAPSSTKIPRALEEPSQLGSKLFKWRVNSKYIDFDHQEWGWGHLTCKYFFQTLIERLHEYESMPWDEIARRDSCHPMPVQNIEPAAQDRLREMFNNEIDTLYQVDTTKRCRLWGYRDRTIFYLIWHDPNHTVYRVKK